MCCRRATGSDADRDRGADIVLELSIGVPHHFVHILGVNESENSANGRSSHPSRYVSPTPTRFHMRPPNRRDRGTTAVCAGHKKIPCEWIVVERVQSWRVARNSRCFYEGRENCQSRKNSDSYK